MSKAKAEPSQQFVKIPRYFGSSDAWRSAGINTRKFIDFLLEEHMAHGGKENGKLKATYQQLEKFGVNRITAAIAEAENRGLVTCHRGGMRVATEYAITWLPRHDGTPPTDEWRNYAQRDAK